jgi:hypothetical protein
MAPVAVGLIERRGEPRLTGGGSRWNTSAVLRPGQPISLINICSRAALVESGSRLRPGALTEMQLAQAGRRASVKGRLERCSVVALEPIRYRGVLIFEQCMDVGESSKNSSE